jgi:hypothetical protein
MEAHIEHKCLVVQITRKNMENMKILILFVLLNVSIACFKVRPRTKLVTLNYCWHICVDGDADCFNSGLNMIAEDHNLNIQHRNDLKCCNVNLSLDLAAEI